MTTTPLKTPQAAPALTSAGLLTVLLGGALNTIDAFIVNVAVPTIGSDLDAGTAMLELVVAGYGIAFAVLLVLGGRLGDAHGRKRMFQLGIAAFTVTSLVCGLAPDVLTLVLARVAQGASAALVMPQVLSIIQAGTTGERRGRAMGWYGATAGLAMVVGQVGGGLLVAMDIGGLGWRPIFLVNVPIGVVGLLVARRTVPESRAADPLRVDGPGTALLGVALLCVLIPLTLGRALSWPLWTVPMLIAAPALAVSFAVVQQQAERAGRVPLLPPSVLRIPSVRRGLGLVMPFFIGFGAYMFVCAVTFQDGLGLGPFGSGLTMGPIAVGFVVASLAAPRLVTRYGRRVVPAGFAILVAGQLLTLATVLVGWPELSVLGFVPCMIVSGLGQGLAVSTAFRVLLSQVPPDRAGVGSGVLATTQQTSLALGVAGLGSLFSTLASPVGFRDAFLVILGIYLLITTTLLALSRRLPDPRGS